MEDFGEKALATLRGLQLAEEAVREQGAKGQLDWERCLAGARRGRQKAWTEEVHEIMREQLLGQVGEEGQAEVRSASGPGAGAFLGGALDGEPRLPDVHFKAAIRRRLRISTQGAAGICRHKFKDEGGRLCGKPLDAKGWHARTCKVGGAVLRRHDRIRDWLAAWLGKMLYQEVATEQFVPKWDRIKRDHQGRPIVEKARLDVVFQGMAGKVYVDVAVVEAGSESAHALTRRALQDGAAAAEEENDKRKRYPGPDLVPFVVEAGGRLGEAAELLIRSVAPKDPVERSAAISEAKRALSNLVQLGNAEVVLGAEQGV